MASGATRLAAPAQTLQPDAADRRRHAGHDAPQHVDRVVGEVAQVAGLPVVLAAPRVARVGRALPRGEGEHGHGVGQRRAEPAQRRQRPLPGLWIARPAQPDRHQRPRLRVAEQRDGRRQLVGGRGDERVVEPQHLPRGRPRVDEPAREHRADRMQRVGERRDDPEVAAPAAQPPQQVRVVVGVDVQDVAARRHDLGRHEVVARQPEPTAQPTQPAAERQARDPGARHDAQRRGQAVLLRGAVEVAEQAAGVRRRRSGRRASTRTRASATGPA